MNKTTSGVELLVKLARHRGVPMRLQLERELRHAIQAGTLPAGTRLPSTRTLARELEISRGVVVEAFEQLLAEGYLVARHGSGTLVAARLGAIIEDDDRGPSAQPPPRFDFRPGLPDLSLFPRRAWIASMRRVLSSPSETVLDYPDPRGPHEARSALARYLNRARATRTSAERIIFSSGSAQGIGLVCRALRARGARRIAVEDPGHADQCTDIQIAGLETPRIPVDEEGLRVDRLLRINPDAVLVTPAHQYPTGVVMSAARRAVLLDWATRRGAFVIEDDYDAEYRYDREPIGALQGLAPDRVVYVGSASKVLSPALRLGWVAAPAELVPELGQQKLHADRGSSALEQLAYGDFIERGKLDRHLRRTRQIYRRRRDILVDAVQRRCPGVLIRGVSAGLHVLIELPNRLDEGAVVQEALRRSIRVYGARAYWARHNGPPALLVGYGGIAETRIRAGVEHLARVLNLLRHRS